MRNLEELFKLLVGFLKVFGIPNLVLLMVSAFLEWRMPGSTIQRDVAVALRVVFGTTVVAVFGFLYQAYRQLAPFRLVTEMPPERARFMITRGADVMMMSVDAAGETDGFELSADGHNTSRIRPLHSLPQGSDDTGWNHEPIIGRDDDLTKRWESARRQSDDRPQA